MKRPRRLSPSFVHAIKRPGRYGDGHGGLGLSLLVRPRRAGGLSKTWAQRVILGGKPTNIGLGSYPVVNLSEARSRALSNRRAIEHGVDPRAKSRAVPTFAEAAERTIEIQSQAWKKGSKSEGQWLSTLKKYVIAQLGDQPVDTIQPRDVMRVLLPIWATLPESARRIRQRISIIMRWAIAQGYRTDNPAGDALAVALPRIASADNHMRALPYVRVAGALHRVRASGAHPARVLCFEFLVLCAVRSSEARFARWSEIDEENATWTIPAERMKGNRTHRVPLSRRALQVLSLARKLADASGFVFPSATGRPLGQNSLTRLCRKLGLDCVPHGMRSSFRDWCAERSDAPREVCELALAHVNSNRVERAYRRSDLFDRRRQLMEEWAQYLACSDSRGESGGR